MPRLFQQHPDAVTEYHDTEALILDPKTKAVHRLNPMASVIWSLVDGSHSADDVTNAIADRVYAPLSILRADVYAQLTDFYAMGLLVQATPAPKTKNPKK